MIKKKLSECEVNIKEYGFSIFKAKGKRNSVKKEMQEFFEAKF